MLFVTVTLDLMQDYWLTPLSCRNRSYRSRLLKYHHLLEVGSIRIPFPVPFDKLCNPFIKLKKSQLTFYKALLLSLEFYLVYKSALCRFCTCMNKLMSSVIMLVWFYSFNILDTKDIKKLNKFGDIR